MAVRTFAAIIHKEEDLYVAECPEAGTVSQGESVEEALLNLKEPPSSIWRNSGYLMRAGCC